MDKAKRWWTTYVASVGVAGYLLGGGVNWLGTYNKWESKNVIFHLTPTASENAGKLLVILLLVTCGRYGYGAENILSMRVVLADGRIAEVTAEKTEVRIFFRLENDFFEKEILSSRSSLQRQAR